MKQPSPSRRALLVFVAACAGVLAAGMAAVAAAGRFAPVVNGLALRLRSRRTT